MRIRMKPYLSNNFSAKKHSKASFGSRNKSLEWNDYSVGIAIPLFGKDLFLGIAIPLFGRDLFHPYFPHVCFNYQGVVKPSPLAFRNWDGDLLTSELFPPDCYFELYFLAMPLQKWRKE
jgi:hypothetical protein